MKVFIDTTEAEKSYAIMRILEALKKYAPKDVEFTNDFTTCDMVVMNVFGRLNHITNRVKGYNKPYIILQYILRGSKNPSTKDWITLWKNAAMVYSYYNLKNLCLEDGVKPDFNFYHSALGVDQTVFKPMERGNKYLICTSGQLYMTESVRECILAAGNRKVMHLGPELNRPNVDCFSGLNDQSLAKLYNQCEFVSGLRRTQGFEMTAAEGLLCGARPIMFDRPHYRDWYDGLAEFIPENSRVEVIENLQKIFNREHIPVSKKEIKEAKKRFNWETIVSGFWKSIN